MKYIIISIIYLLSVKSIAQSFAPDNTFGINGAIHLGPAGPGHTFYNGMPIKACFEDALVVDSKAFFLTTNGYSVVRVDETGTFQSYLINTQQPNAVDFDFKHLKYINNSLYVFGKIFTNNGSYSQSIFIEKLSLDGIPDPAFGTNGCKVIDFGGWETMHDIILTPDGNLLCTGTYKPASTSDVKMMSFKINEATGEVIIQNNPSGIMVYDLIISVWEDAGYITPYNNNYILTGLKDDSNNKLVFLNINQNGEKITSYGTNGYKFATLTDWQTTKIVKVKSNGNRIYCNTRIQFSQFGYPRKLVCYDLSTDQIIFNNAGEGNTGVSSFNVADDGIYTTIVSNSIGQYTDETLGDNDEFLLIRKLPNGVRDTSFNIAGSYSYSSPTLSTQYDQDTASTVLKLDNGNILIGGYTSYASENASTLSYYGLSIVRITNGQLGLNPNPNNKPVLYPNPFQNKVTFKAEIPISQIEIYDLTGRKIMDSGLQTENQELVINIPDGIAKGTYVAKVYTTDGKVFSEKVVKK